MRNSRGMLVFLAGVVVLLALAWQTSRAAAFQAAETPTPTATVTETPTPTPTPTPTSGPPQVYPSATCGQVSNVVVVDGANFTPSALVQVTWSGMVVGSDPAPVQVDPAGRFEFEFIVPNDYPGPHVVRTWDGVRTAQFSFSLGVSCPPPPPTATPFRPTPTYTPTPSATPPTPVTEEARLFCEPDGAVPNMQVAVRGENFHPGGHFYQLRWDGVIIPWAPEGLTVGDDGRFTLWFAAPSDTYELHTLVADDGQGSSAACYINLMPRDPTPTWTPTVTLTPTPSPTWTPGPPPGITLTPTASPEPTQFCATVDAAFTRHPLADARIDAGLVVTNTNVAWPDNRVQVGIWRYYNLASADTGARATLPAMAPGEQVPVHLELPAAGPGPTWFQARLLDAATGQALDCASDWYPLYVRSGEPYPPPLVLPSDGAWLDNRQLSLDWLEAGVPDGAGPVDGYEVHLMDVAGGGLSHGEATLLYQASGPYVTGWAYGLSADYGDRQLAWRARAHNAAGWGLWAGPFYFGVDTVSPEVTMSLHGQVGDHGWWRSPVEVRVGGWDAQPGSGLKATYLQVGDGRWQQVIPGGENEVDLEGIYVVRAYGRDRALNRSRVVVRPVKIDRHAPTVEVLYSQEATSSGWYTAPLTLSVAAADVLSGVAIRRIRVADRSSLGNGGAWLTDSVHLDTEGAYAVEFAARDVAGNDTAVQETNARLDLTPPTGAIALNGSLCQTCQPAVVSVTAGDSASGVAHWALSLVLPPARSHDGLVHPLGDTVLASGSDPTRDMPLDGRVLPPGDLALRLAVQDVAGWLAIEELAVVNTLYQPGPTPTPWVMATATPWPSPTPGAPLPYVTITPTATSQASGSGGRPSCESCGGGGSAPEGYPVGDTRVPAVLPVTGAVSTGTLLLWLLSGLLLLGLGRAMGCGWSILMHRRERKED
jgi:hypothetical protein